MLKYAKEYKKKQLKLFFRFLKEYNRYNKFIRMINEDVEKWLNKEQKWFFYSGCYMTITYKNIMNHLLFEKQPNDFLQVFYNHIETREEFYLLRVLWNCDIKDLYEKGETIFDSIDYKRACKIIKGIK